MPQSYAFSAQAGKILKRHQDKSDKIKSRHPQTMIYKEKYMEKLRRDSPGEPEEWYALAWHFRSAGKARLYAGLLASCNANADIAEKVVRRMYVSCDIGLQTALSEKFIRLLLPLACMEKRTKPHSVAYHIRKMLREDSVREERRKEEERLRRSARQESAPSPRRKLYVVEIPDPTDEIVQGLMRWARESGSSVFGAADIGTGGSGRLSLRSGASAGKTSGGVFSYAVPGLAEAGYGACLRAASGSGALSASLAKRRSVFGREEPCVRYFVNLIGRNCTDCFRKG